MELQHSVLSFNNDDYDAFCNVTRTIRFVYKKRYDNIKKLLRNIKLRNIALKNNKTARNFMLIIVSFCKIGASLHSFVCNMNSKFSSTLRPHLLCPLSKLQDKCFKFNKSMSFFDSIFEKLTSCQEEVLYSILNEGNNEFDFGNLGKLVQDFDDLISELNKYLDMLFKAPMNKILEEKSVLVELTQKTESTSEKLRSESFKSPSQTYKDLVSEEEHRSSESKISKFDIEECEIAKEMRTPTTAHGRGLLEGYVESSDIYKSPVRYPRHTHSEDESDGNNRSEYRTLPASFTILYELSSVIENSGHNICIHIDSIVNRILGHQFESCSPLSDTTTSNICEKMEEEFASDSKDDDCTKL